MSKTIETLNDIFRLIIRFFAILGFLCFLDWLYLLITGEYVDMIKSIGMFTGRVVTTSVICVAIWKGAIYYRNRRTYEVEADQPEEHPLPEGMTTSEYLAQLEKKKSELNFYDIDRIRKENKGRQEIILKMNNWIKFWTESKNQYRMIPHYQKLSRNQIKRMEAEAKKRSSPIELKPA